MPTNTIPRLFLDSFISVSKATEEEQAREMKKAKSTTEPNEPTAEDALDTSAEEEFTNNQGRVFVAVFCVGIKLLVCKIFSRFF